MSKRAVTFSRSAAWCAVALLSLLPVLVSAQQAVPTLAQLDADLARMSVDVKAAQARLDAARRSAVLAADDSVVVEGITIHVNRSMIVESDRKSIEAGVRAGLRDLRKRGGSSARLLDGDVWSIETSAGARDAVWMRPGVGARASWGLAVSHPIRSEQVRRFTIQRAGQRVSELHPKVSAFVGTAYTLESPDRVYHVAHRNFVTSSSSVARRCATGALSACATIFDERQREQWYDATDSIRPGRGPVPASARASLLTYAMEINPDTVMQRLLNRRAVGETGVAVLASAAGISEDDLLRGWHHKLTGAGRTRATPDLGTTLSSLLWAGLFLIVAIRRRPL